MNKNSARDIPIACSLSAGDLAKRQAAWRTLLDNSLLVRERVQGGGRVAARPYLAERAWSKSRLNWRRLGVVPQLRTCKVACRPRAISHRLRVADKYRSRSVAR